MKKIGLRQFLIFWISQSVSQLGSAMTSFAMTIWIYKENKFSICGINDYFLYISSYGHSELFFRGIY